jgi:uncharacterized protein (TIGR04222 family)
LTRHDNGLLPGRAIEWLICCGNDPKTREIPVVAISTAVADVHLIDTASGPAYGVGVFSTVWSYAAVAMAIAAIPSAAIAFLARRRVSRGPRRRTELDTYAIAYVAGELESEGGGIDRIILTSIGGLRAAGAILVTPSGNSGVTGRAPSDQDQVASAIFAAADRHRPRHEIFADPDVVTAARGVQTRLLRNGWLLSERDMLRWRRMGLLPLTVLAIDVLLIITGPLLNLTNPAAPPPAESVTRAFGWTFCPLVILAIALWVGRPPVISRRARKAVERLRTNNPELAPESHPSWTQLGASRAALGVALYGEAAMRASDPAYTGRPR